MILIRVDLPAPLSPASATTSPASTPSDTLSSARTAAKFFETERTSSSRPGAPSAIFALPRQPALALVDQDRDDDDHADRDELPERLDIDEDEPILDDGDD